METLTASVAFHPSRLTNCEIQRWQKQARHFREHAPLLFDWLGDFLRAEQTRRLRICIGQFTEPSLPRFPFDISGTDLAEAVEMATMLSYSARTYEAGRLFDALTETIISMTAHRLKESST